MGAARDEPLGRRDEGGRADVDGGAPGAARAAPEGAGRGACGRGDRGMAGAGRPAAGRARDRGPGGGGGELAAWLERADPPRSGRATPVRRVVGAIAWHLRVGGPWRALAAARAT